MPPDEVGGEEEVVRLLFLQVYFGACNNITDNAGIYCMKNKIKHIFFNSLFFKTLPCIVFAALIAGCASGGPAAKTGNGVTADEPAADTVPEKYAESIGLLAQRVDTLHEKFMMMPGSRQVPAGLREKWALLNAEAERLRDAVNADVKLEYVLGELSRIGIFFNVPGAAQTAEYYLSECVGMGGGLDGRDYRPYFSLAWLNLHKGCQLSEKTGDLLLEFEKRAPDWEAPYVAMLKGYYYYSCRHDPEKAIGFLQSYLTFNPADERACAIYKSIKKGH